MSFSVMFWNIERFGGDPKRDSEKHLDRVKAVAAHIRKLEPDLLCLCEIDNEDEDEYEVLRLSLTDELSEYDFAITDSIGNMELLIGWKRDTFEQVLFTQRYRFQVDRSYLRSGALTSVKFDNEFFSFLFLHTKAKKKASDYGYRQKMFRKIWGLKGKLDKVSGGDDRAKFVVMGDLNTMGRRKYKSRPAISAEQELKRLIKDAKSNGMRMLPKTHEKTWRGRLWGRMRESNLDHVLATGNVSFESFQDSKKVRVFGWNGLEKHERNKFIEDLSDHSALFCKVISKGSENWSGNS